MERMAVVDGAYIQCAAGTHIPQLAVTPNDTEIENYNVASVFDSKKGENIKPFGICAFTQKPCDPQTHGQWLFGEPSILLGNAEVVLDTESILICDVGGVIAVVEQGQISVNINSPELAYEDPDAPHGLWTWIPVVGSEGMAGYAAGKGNKGEEGMYHVLAVLDAATFGVGGIVRKGAQESGKAALRKLSIRAAGRLAAGNASKARLLAGKTTRQIFAEARARAQELTRVFKEKGREAFERAKNKLAEEDGFAQIGPSSRSKRAADNAVRADDAISGSLKKSPSYHSELGGKTKSEIDILAKGKGEVAKKAKQMKKLIEQGERLQNKGNKK
jgi:hypothetical protein